MSDLQEKLKARASGKASPGAVDVASVREDARHEDAAPEHFEGTEAYLHEPTVVDKASMRVRGIDVECIVGSCLMRVSFKEGTNPAEVPGLLRTFDPGAKLRDEWPQRGGGPKEILSGALFQIAMDATREFKKITMTALPPDGDAVTFDVRKNQKEVVEKLIALGSLAEGNAAKLKKAWDENGTCTLLLRDASEAMTVKYVKGFDGKSYYFEDVEAAKRDEAAKTN